MVSATAGFVAAAQEHGEVVADKGVVAHIRSLESVADEVVLHSPERTLNPPDTRISPSLWPAALLPSDRSG